MKLFDKEFYRALVAGFLIGTAAMGLTVGAAQVRADSGSAIGSPASR